MLTLESIASVTREVGKAASENVSKMSEKIKDISETGIKETINKQIESIKESGDAVLTKLDEIKNLTPEQLREKFESLFNETNNNANSEGTDSDEKHEGLTGEEKKKIKEETGWSDEIIDAIGSMKEYEVYKNAGLAEAEIGGKKCLIRTDIDWEQKDSMGRTNKERAEQGLSPINKEGKVVELHHIGQHSDSPLAELTTDEHRGKGNDSILHDKNKESEIDRQSFSYERTEHWQSRANEGGN